MTCACGKSRGSGVQHQEMLRENLPFSFEPGIDWQIEREPSIFGDFTPEEWDQKVARYDELEAEWNRINALFPEAERTAMEGVPHPCNSPARRALIKAALIGAGFVAAVAAAEYVLKTGEEKEALSDD